jgi:hypothetical protein
MNIYEKSEITASSLLDIIINYLFSMKVNSLNLSLIDVPFPSEY